MISFLKFSIFEETDSNVNKELSHLDHPYQMHVLHGKNGAVSTIRNLRDTHNYFKTGKSNTVFTSRKVDGGVSVILKNHPTFGFSVSTKSAFNVNPKINYTEEDIEKNHGHAPGLVSALKHVLKHGRNLIKPGHTVQGDLLYTHNDNKSSTNNPKIFSHHTSSTPNRIEYRHSGPPKKFGIALHTEYENNVARSGVSSKALNHSKDIFVADTSYEPKTHHYEEKHQNLAEKHLTAAEDIVKKHPEHFDISKEHKEHLLTYMNSLRTKTGPITSPTHEGYIEHLNKISAKRQAGVKTPKAKEQKTSSFKNIADEVSKNRPKFKSIFDFHNHINKVTEALTSTLEHNKPSNFTSHIDNASSTDEGIVVANKNTRNIHFKLVPNRIASALKYNPRFQR
jgi:hypothetical protein